MEVATVPKGLARNTSEQSTSMKQIMVKHKQNKSVTFHDKEKDGKNISSESPTKLRDSFVTDASSAETGKPESKSGSRRGTIYGGSNQETNEKVANLIQSGYNKTRR